MKKTAKTLFIIEDDNQVLSMMKNYFEYLGYNRKDVRRSG
jgi:hypothetical protein